MKGDTTNQPSSQNEWYKSEGQHIPPAKMPKDGHLYLQRRSIFEKAGCAGFNCAEKSRGIELFKPVYPTQLSRC